ncbi:hypothetical protein CH63R_01777 [Colletotrichum higginsianum IMI 349063]|uniref:Uncharacterized protein n=2 Tax=Colletotrichum higginsianum TaxID=80884 RepID=A0A1B7YX28_COLHI|nr:hypothetical protein CH63R_01777 [Colletotrichum higginsianum IMI 349063]OBR16597.1 hypothetical protein CH63R_01777 [Colletotrichum higginsianum IMI 349063]TIC89425.1 hypothetical protein CH35J_012902 [Colletotrichum higginsianum]
MTTRLVAQAEACSAEEVLAFLNGQNNLPAVKGAILVKLSTKDHDDQLVVLDPTQPGSPSTVIINVTRIAPDAGANSTTANPDADAVPVPAGPHAGADPIPASRPKVTFKLLDVESRTIAEIQATKPTSNNSLGLRGWRLGVSLSSSSYGQLAISTTAPSGSNSSGRTGYSNTPHNIADRTLRIERLIEIKPKKEGDPSTWEWEFFLAVDVRVLVNQGTLASPKWHRVVEDLSPSHNKT